MNKIFTYYEKALHNYFISCLFPLPCLWFSYHKSVRLKPLKIGRKFLKNSLGDCLWKFPIWSEHFQILSNLLVPVHAGLHRRHLSITGWTLLGRCEEFPALLQLKPRSQGLSFSRSWEPSQWYNSSAWPCQKREIPKTRKILQRKGCHACLLFKVWHFIILLIFLTFLELYLKSS